MAIMEGKAVQLHNSTAFVQLKDTCDWNVYLVCACSFNRMFNRLISSTWEYGNQGWYKL